MDDLTTFLQALNIGEKVEFVLSGIIITGVVKTPYNSELGCIEISYREDVKSGSYKVHNITISEKNILGWSKIPIPRK